MNLKSSCYPFDSLIVNISLAFIDGALAVVAFSQAFFLVGVLLWGLGGGLYKESMHAIRDSAGSLLIHYSLFNVFVLTRIHVRNQQVGWTRQKVVHLMIGSSNLGYSVYFIATIIATCNGWLCWSHACGFIFMAYPKILFLAAFLLLLSFWIDLCHQANDDEEEEDGENSNQPLLLDGSKSKPSSSHLESHWRCFSLCGTHIGSRQKFVIVVVMVIFILMVLFAVIIWIGAGKNPIDSSAVAQVYVDLFAIAILILGGALGCYGLLLFLKLRRVSYANASCEMRKIAGLAVLSVVCFTSSATVGFITDIPLFYHWNMKKLDDAKVLSLLVLYYFIGFSVPSAFMLWMMRELPTPVAIDRRVQSRIITFIHRGAEGTLDARSWATATSSKNQVLRASPV